MSGSHRPDSSAPGSERDERPAPELPGSSPDLPLTAWRLADWAFLLPGRRLGRVRTVGALPDPEAAALAASGADLSDAEREEPDDVVVLAPSRHAEDVQQAVGSLADGGWLVTQRRRRTPMSRMTHESRRSWRRRLMAVGLRHVTVHWQAPRAERCSYLVSLDDKPALDFMLRRHAGVRFGLAKSLVARALVRIGLADLLARDVVVTAQKPTRCGTQSSRRPFGSRLLITPWFETSRHVVVMDLDPRIGAPLDVTKLPRRRWDVGAIEHEAMVLREVERLAPVLACCVPRVREEIRAPWPGLRESPLLGQMVSPEAVRSRPGSVLQAGEAFVRSIPVTSSTDAEAGWFRRLLEGPLTELAISGLLDDVADDVAATLTALQPLRSAHLPLVIVHGDLGHPNLVLTPEGLMGALDWERAELAGLPLFDACFFLQYVSESRRGAFTRAAQLRCFDEVFTGSRAWGAAVLHREADRLGVDRALVPPLVLATWAVSAAGLLRRVLPPRTGQGAPAPLAHLPDVLETFAEDRDVALWRHAVRRFSRISIN